MIYIGIFGFVPLKKIEYRYPHGVWDAYVQVVFSEELAFKLNGIMSDEGVSGKWHPAPHKYPSYKSWVTLCHSYTSKHFANDKDVLSSINESIKIELECAPENLRDC